MRRSSTNSISDADQADAERGGQHARAGTSGSCWPDVEQARDQLTAKIGAQHVERAVREIDDARDAEHDRQSGGDDEQRRGARQPVQRLHEEEGQHPGKRRLAAAAAASRGIRVRQASRRRAARGAAQVAGLGLPSDPGCTTPCARPSPRLRGTGIWRRPRISSSSWCRSCLAWWSRRPRRPASTGDRCARIVTGRRWC